MTNLTFNTPTKDVYPQTKDMYVDEVSYIKKKWEQEKLYPKKEVGEESKITNGRSGWQLVEGG